MNIWTRCFGYFIKILSYFWSAALKNNHVAGGEKFSSENLPGQN